MKQIKFKNKFDKGGGLLVGGKKHLSGVEFDMYKNALKKGDRKLINYFEKTINEGLKKDYNERLQLAEQYADYADKDRRYGSNTVEAFSNQQGIRQYIPLANTLSDSEIAHKHLKDNEYFSAAVNAVGPIWDLVEAGIGIFTGGLSKGVTTGLKTGLKKAAKNIVRNKAETKLAQEGIEEVVENTAQKQLSQPTLNNHSIKQAAEEAIETTIKKSSDNFEKNMEDLLYAKKYYEKNGYEFPDNLEELAKSDAATDEFIKKIIDQHNTFIRGVSTNFEALGENSNIINTLLKAGIDYKNNPQQAAEYMATHIPGRTGYGRFGMSKAHFQRGLDGLYASNSRNTAEGYTYGNGYIVKVKRPTLFEGKDRKNWISANEIDYVKEEDILDVVDDFPLYNDLSSESIYVARDEPDRIKKIFENRKSSIKDEDFNQIESVLKDWEKDVKQVMDARDRRQFEIIDTEYGGLEELGKNAQLQKEYLAKYANPLEEQVLNVLNNQQNFYIEKLKNLKKVQELLYENSTVRKPIKAAFNPNTNYAHYIFPGQPGSKVFDVVDTEKITPDIWKYGSRGHYGDYTPGLSTAVKFLPALGLGLYGGNRLYSNEQTIQKMNGGILFRKGGSTKNMSCNKPKRTPDHPTKSHVVKACENGKEKVIRFGQQGVKGSPKKKGESESYRKRRESFKARHAKNISKGKMSAAYWADKVKWQNGGELNQGNKPKEFILTKTNIDHTLDGYKLVNGKLVKDNTESVKGYLKALDETKLKTESKEYKQYGKNLYSKLRKGGYI